MAEEREGRPVLAGLLALVAVGMVVGLVISLLTLASASVLGLGGSSGGGGGSASARQSMYLPTPEPTQTPSGPLVTLAPGETQAARPSARPKKPKQQQISLAAGQTEVSSMGRIDLSGTYPGGEGAIVQVQRFENGRWIDFAVDASVRGGAFSTYVMTGRTGENRLRVVDTESGLASNAVTVTVR